MLSEGRLLGHYRLVQRVGRGGMGEVYLAEDTRIDRQVAIKVVQAEIEPYPDPVKMQDKVRLFQREMRVITMLDHPHILPLFDFGEEKDGNMIVTYMVMPYRQEGSLVDWLQQRGNSEKLTPSEVSHFVTQAADALQHAHNRNLIHQDVKPSNFLVYNRSGNMLPDLLLMDFGTAKVTTATVTASQNIRGTPAFMAPEQWEGRPQPATDQYALAVMAYLLLTGDAPFSGRMEQVMHQHFTVQPQPPGTLNPVVSPELDAVILRALEKQPEKRFPSILEFAQAFQRAHQFTSAQGPIILAAKQAEILMRSGDGAAPGKMPLSVSASLPPTIYPTKVGELAPTVAASNPGLSVLTPTVAATQSGSSIQAPNIADPNLGFSAQAPTVADINILGPNSRMPQTPPNAPDAINWRMPKLLAQVPGIGNWRMPQLLTQAPGIRKKISAAKKYRLSPQILVALVILVSLSIVIGMGLFFQNQVNQVNASSLARSNAILTAQASAQAQATVTAQVIANNPYPSYLTGSGTLAFVDPLSKPGEWSSSGTGTCQFTGGAYHVKTQRNTLSCNSRETFSNFAFEVQLTITRGDCGGMTFRDNGSGHFYAFSICQDGTYEVVRSTSRVKVLTSDNINNLGNQPHTIAVVANGSSMTFYVDGRQVDREEDNNNTSGSIGLIADPQFDDATDVAYTNARVWRL